ncbi:MAG TPA: hypothetical protein VJ183_15025 [Chloroflexia bacterium]|nr:hypothetical protein [Chloroflexia bacterium]
MAETNHPIPQVLGQSPIQALRTPYSEEAEQRRARRLAEELGINPPGVQVVLRLRRQVVELQTRVQQLEGELKTERTRTETRFVQYRREYREAIWEDAPPEL